MSKVYTYKKKAIYCENDGRFSVKGAKTRFNTPQEARSFIDGDFKSFGELFKSCLIKKENVK